MPKPPPTWPSYRWTDFRYAVEHLRDLVAIPVRHLGGAMHLQNVECLIVARDSATRFQRNAGVAADRTAQARRQHGHGGTRHRRRRSLCVRDRLGRQSDAHKSPGGSFAETVAGSGSIVERHQIGGILGDIGVVGKHDRDRLADIAHAVCASTAADRAQALLDLVSRKSIGGSAATSCEGPDRKHARQLPARPTHRSTLFCHAPRASGQRASASWPGKEMSAAKRPCPVSSGRSSSRGTERPIECRLAASADPLIGRASLSPRRAPP